MVFDTGLLLKFVNGFLKSIRIKPHLKRLKLA